MSFYADIQHFRNDHHPRLTITVFQNKRLHTKFRLTLNTSANERLPKGPQNAGKHISEPTALVLPPLGLSPWL